MEKKIGRERREFLRFDASLKMRYKILFSEIEGIATLKNISRGGMGFSVIKGKDLLKDASADFEIDVPGEDYPILTKGKAVWFNKVSAEDASLLSNGVEFVDIRPADKSILLDYAYDRWAEKQSLRNK
ncbi:MAG: PilZ domain-containing protein [Candidatus Omnitrophota bacterium]|nr:PilZ domain-containing protein [Candidatus Omnitrophota bacterium]